MDLTSYDVLTQEHPELGPCLDDLLGPECMKGGRDHRDMTRREWIERHVLDVRLVPSSFISLKDTNEGRPIDVYAAGNPSSSTEVFYTVYYSVVVRVDRADSFVKRQANGDSLGQTLRKILTEHGHDRVDRLTLGVIARQTIVRQKNEPYYLEEVQLYQPTSTEGVALFVQSLAHANT